MKRLIIILIALTGCSTNEPQTALEPPQLPVLASTAVLRDVAEQLSVTGELRPSAIVDIHSQVSGKVAKVLVQEGQWVEVGSPLFLIDTQAYRLKVEEASADLAKQRASLEDAQKTLQRFEGLAKKELISKREWDELEAKVGIAKAELALGQAKLKSAKLDLKHCQIASPIKGRIGKLDVHPGQLINEAPLAQVAALDPLICEYKLTEKEFMRLTIETTQLDIVPLSSPDVVLKAKTTFVDNHFDPKSGQILLRASLANGHYFVRPGQIVRVMIPVAISKQAICVPQRAIKYNHQGPYVYLIQEDQTVVERPLALGMNAGDEQVVLEGITPADLIVTEGHQRLYPGAKVSIKS